MIVTQATIAVRMLAATLICAAAFATPASAKTFDPHSGTPDDFTKLLMSEMKIWTPIVQATGFQMN
jgi:hypothetical protein